MKTPTKKDARLNEESRAFLQGFSDTFASIAHLSIPEKRKTIRELFLPPLDQLEPIDQREDRVIQGTHGDIPLRILTPKNPRGESVLLFFHRGGWVFGSNDESEGVCRKIANQTRGQVVMVNYRLSPENKFPVPLEDCYDATRWVSENMKSSEGNSKKIVVMGESAGGNLAAATCLMARHNQGPNIEAQVLLYPFMTTDLWVERYENSPDKHLLSYDNVQWFWEQYLNNFDDGKNEFVSPLKADDLSNLPKTLIMTAEYDALCKEGHDYADKLKEAGVDVSYKEYAGSIHGFLDIPIVSPKIDEAYSDLKTFLENL